MIMKLWKIIIFKVLLIITHVYILSLFLLTYCLFDPIAVFFFFNFIFL